MATFIISRHKAAAEFLAEQGFGGAEVVEQADDRFWARVKPGDLIVGTLPVHLAARAFLATWNPFGFLDLDVPPEARGKELSVEDMLAYGASVKWYSVTEIRPPQPK